MQILSGIIIQPLFLHLPAVKISHTASHRDQRSLHTTYPFHKLLASVGPTRRMISKLCTFISEPHRPLLGEATQCRDLSSVNDEEICWNTEWENLYGASKNPDHQLIYFKFVHRMYLTPRRRHSMKIITSPNWDLCPHLYPWDHLCICIRNAPMWLDVGNKYL